MFKQFRIVGLCLVAVLAMSAVAASTASAKEPVWYVCEEGTVGPFFKNHLCKEAATGSEKWEKRELLSGEKRTVTSEQKSTEAAKKKMKAKVGGFTFEITCKKNKDTGEIIGGRPGTDKILTETFEECTTASNGCKLENGTITVNKSNTTLRWRESTGEEALDQIVPEATFAKVFAKFKLINCNFGIGNGEWKVENELLGWVKPAKTMTTPGELWFSTKETAPCPLITKYWTGDPLTRVEHSITSLEVNGPLGKGPVEEFCEVKTLTLSGGSAGWAFGVFPEKMEL